MLPIFFYRIQHWEVFGIIGVMQILKGYLELGCIKIKFVLR